MTLNTTGKTQIIQSESGFTIIEVVIAIGIFAIGFLAVGLMQINAMNTTNSARRTTEAMALAEDYAETLRSLPFYDKSQNLDGVGGADPYDILPELRSGDHPQVGDPPVPGNAGPYTIRWTVDHNRPLPPYPAGVLDSVNAVPNSMTIRVWVTPDNNPNDIQSEIEFAKFCGDPDL